MRNCDPAVDLPGDDPIEIARDLLGERAVADDANLAAAVERIISDRLWEATAADFGSFAINTLSVDTDLKLYLLRFAMDAESRHANEWADVLTVVDAQSRERIIDAGGTIRAAPAKSLETLAKSVRKLTHAPISYLPSRLGGPAVDRQILQARQGAPQVLRRLAKGELDVVQLRAALDEATSKRTGAEPASPDRRINDLLREHQEPQVAPVAAPAEMPALEPPEPEAAPPMAPSLSPASTVSDEANSKPPNDSPEDVLRSAQRLVVSLAVLTPETREAARGALDDVLRELSGGVIHRARDIRVMTLRGPATVQLSRENFDRIVHGAGEVTGDRLNAAIALAVSRVSKRKKDQVTAEDLTNEVRKALAEAPARGAAA